MKLSQQSIMHFRQVGYLRISTGFSEEKVQRLQEEVQLHFKQAVPPLRKDASGKVVRLDQVYQRSQLIRDVFLDSAILDALESLLGPNIELTLNRHNHVTLNTSSATLERLHRDILQWSRSVVTAILYLDDSTTENGSTLIIPGSQYLPFVGTPNNGGTWMDEHHVYSDMINQAVPIPMQKGDVLLFDSLAFHTVGRNKTDTERMSICMGFHSVDELVGGKPRHLALMKGERLYRGNDS